MRKRSLLALALVATFGLCAQGRIRVDRDDPGCPGAACTTATTTSTTVPIYTGWTDVGEYDSITFELTFTDATNSVTTLFTTCQTSDDKTAANGAGFEVCSVGVAAGTGTRTCPYTDVLTTGVAEKFSQTWTNLPHSYVNCAYLVTGAPLTADTLLLGVKRRNY